MDHNSHTLCSLRTQGNKGLREIKVYEPSAFMQSSASECKADNTVGYGRSHPALTTCTMSFAWSIWCYGVLIYKATGRMYKLKRCPQSFILSLLCTPAEDKEIMERNPLPYIASCAGISPGEGHRADYTGLLWWSVYQRDHQGSVLEMNELLTSRRNHPLSLLVLFSCTCKTSHIVCVWRERGREWSLH